LRAGGKERAEPIVSREVDEEVKIPFCICLVRSCLDYELLISISDINLMVPRVRRIGVSGTDFVSRCFAIESA
jgi:hypothetical protein